MIERPLEDGLVLRSLSTGYASDRDNLPAFYQNVFGEEPHSHDPSYTLAHWTRDLMSGSHPTVTPDDIWVVVDGGQDDRIVSALVLIPQTWRYADVPFDVGRVELVATLPQYRRRGLVRRLMQVAHERSAALGHTVQAITGIGHYYRQFGYAMSLDYGPRAVLPFAGVPGLPDDREPAFTLRPAAEADIPDLINWDTYMARTQGAGLSTVRGASMWRYDLFERHPGATVAFKTYIIQDRESQGVGYVALSYGDSQSTFNCNQYVVGDRSSYLATFDDVLRGLRDLRDAHCSAEANRPEMLVFSANLPAPIDTLVRKSAGGALWPYTYAWYIRVPDLPAFIKRIAPVLEARLIGSGAHRFTGDVTVGFFEREALHITLADGRLTNAALEPTPEQTDAAYPFHYFLDVVFGRRSSYEIRYIVPEVFTNRKAEILFEAMFPQTRTTVMPVA